PGSRINPKVLKNPPIKERARSPGVEDPPRANTTATRSPSGRRSGRSSQRGREGFMSAPRTDHHLLIVAVALFGAAALGRSTLARADGTGWYAPPQVAQGRWEYSQKCGVCHGAQLEGAGAPALKGKVFNERWNGKKLSEFYEFVHADMPLGLGASL